MSTDTSLSRSSSVSVDKEAKKAVYKDFNKALKTFIREMMVVYPEVKELKMMIAMYKVIKTISYKRPQRIFNSFVAEKYSQNIIDGDFDVFLQESFTYDGFNDICDGLKKAFKEVDEQNKKIIRDHLLVLLCLNKKCLEI